MSLIAVITYLYCQNSTNFNLCVDQFKEKCVPGEMIDKCIQRIDKNEEKFKYIYKTIEDLEKKRK